MTMLPQDADWGLSNNVMSTPPFAVLRVNFTSMTGSITAWRTTERLTKVHRLAADFGSDDGDTGFWSTYSIAGKQGRFEATIDPQGVLDVAFTTGSVKNNFTARPTRIVWGGRREYSASIAGLSYTGKLEKAIARALPLMPSAVAEQVRGLVSPTALSIMVATTAAWMVSHFFGIGEIADLVLIVTGVAMVGGAAIDIASDLQTFAKKGLGAESGEDLDIAGQHFAAAIAKGGVNLVAAILLRRFAHGKRPFRDMFEGRQPYSPRTGKPLKSSPGKWFYRREFLRDLPGRASPENLRGNTSPEGDVFVSKDPSRYPTENPLMLERLKTFRHESMHSFLTPRLQFLRELRIQLRDGSYQRSYIFRYLEEALAEAYGRYNSIGDMPKAIRFPVDKGYVTIAKLGQEAKGIAQGSINVGGTIYRVFLADGADQPTEYEYDDAVVQHGGR